MGFEPTTYCLGNNGTIRCASSAYGASDRIRTYGLLFRRQLHYPLCYRRMIRVTGFHTRRLVPNKGIALNVRLHSHMEAPIGFEPMNKAFAEPSLNRLGREPSRPKHHSTRP